MRGEDRPKRHSWRDESGVADGLLHGNCKRHTLISFVTVALSGIQVRERREKEEEQSIVSLLPAVNSAMRCIHGAGPPSRAERV